MLHCLTQILPTLLLGLAAQVPGPDFRPFGPAGPPEALFGVWQTRGYGWIAEVGPGGVRMFDHSPAGTLEQTGDIADVLVQMQHAVRGEQLLLTLVPGRSTVYTLERRPGLPDGAARPPAADPRSCFDYLWGVMAHHYAYFDERGVDWDARRAAHRARVTEATTDAELWDVLCELLGGFGDAHLSLTGRVAGEERSFGDGPAPDLDPALAAAFAAQDEHADLEAYRRRWRGDYVRRIHADLLGGRGRTAAWGQVVWGRIGAVGYVNVFGMGGFVQSEDPREDMAGAERVMAAVLEDLASCPGLVLDITLNSGGYEEVQMAISSRFVDEPRPGFAKRALDGAGTELQTFYLAPAEGPRYLRPVRLVTSGFTVSAGEDFTLAMRELPHVTHVGHRTRGSFSDMLEKRLPNGWVLTLSNEAYFDLEGRNWEARGVPPEVEVPIFVTGRVGSSHVEAIRSIAAELEREVGQ